MNSLPTDPFDRRHTDKWLEKSLGAPSPSLIYERSDGEKAASERLIREKAKTERWNREISRFLFALRLLVVSLPLAVFLGALLGYWLAR
jgi:hypothetical protein